MEEESDPFDELMDRRRSLQILGTSYLKLLAAGSLAGVCGGCGGKGARRLVNYAQQFNQGMVEREPLREEIIQNILNNVVSHEDLKDDFYNGKMVAVAGKVRRDFVISPREKCLMFRLYEDEDVSERLVQKEEPKEEGPYVSVMVDKGKGFSRFNLSPDGSIEKFDLPDEENGGVEGVIVLFKEECKEVRAKISFRDEQIEIESKLKEKPVIETPKPKSKNPFLELFNSDGNVQDGLYCVIEPRGDDGMRNLDIYARFLNGARNTRDGYFVVAGMYHRTGGRALGYSGVEKLIKPQHVLACKGNGEGPPFVMFDINVNFSKEGIAYKTIEYAKRLDKLDDFGGF